MFVCPGCGEEVDGPHPCEHPGFPVPPPKNYKEPKSKPNICPGCGEEVTSPHMGCGDFEW